MKKIGFIAALLGTFLLGAMEIFIGSGVVVDAKLSPKKPEIAGFDADFFPGLPERRIYAMLTIDVPETRKISIFDYRIEIFGRDYPCVALRQENGKWQTTTTIFPGGKRYSLLFILNSGMVGMREQEAVMLKNCGSQVKTAIPLQNLRDRAF